MSFSWFLKFHGIKENRSKIETIMLIHWEKQNKKNINFMLPASTFSSTSCNLYIIFVLEFSESAYWIESVYFIQIWAKYLVI